MRVLVAGAGAVGGLLGARLVRSGVDVTFLVRERTAEQLRRDGLRIADPSGAVQSIAVRAVRADAVGGRYDLIVLAVRTVDLPSALEDVAPAVGPDTMILPLLNGVGHLNALDNRCSRRSCCAHCQAT